ncbi:MAG: hypothetical protein Q9188_006239 [Gyalolechia gomerana]
MQDHDFTLGAQVTHMLDWANGPVHLHNEKGFVHRDIKPGNLGITNYNNPRGFFFDLDLATQKILAVGNQAGEGAEIKAKVDLQKAEMWALGLSVYAMITSRQVDWYQYDDENERDDEKKGDDENEQDDGKRADDENQEDKGNEGAAEKRLEFHDYVTKPRWKKLCHEFDLVHEDARDLDCSAFIGFCKRLLHWEPNVRPSARLTLTKMEDLRRVVAPGTLISREEER